MFIPGGSCPVQSTAYDQPGSGLVASQGPPNARTQVHSRCTSLRERQRHSRRRPRIPSIPTMSINNPPAAALAGPRPSREAAYRPIARQRQWAFPGARRRRQVGFGVDSVSAEVPLSRPPSSVSGDDTGGREGGMQGDPDQAIGGGRLHEDLSRDEDVVGASDRAFGLTHRRGLRARRRRSPGARPPPRPLVARCGRHRPRDRGVPAGGARAR